MKFTFGIITNGNEDVNLQKCISSIHNLKIPIYEIIVVGNTKINDKKIKIITFNEKSKRKINFRKKGGWITKKKNIITKEASYDNIVYCHDYISFQNDWYKGFQKFGDDFDICMTKIINKDQTRYRDWVLWPHNDSKIDKIIAKNRMCLIPYYESDLISLMYVSGAYWVGKKIFMESYPLNEKLYWGEGEDVEWSKRIRKVAKYVMNTFSEVQLLKQKDNPFVLVDAKTLSEIKKILK